jgi:hypothetical protein
MGFDSSAILLYNYTMSKTKLEKNAVHMDLINSWLSELHQRIESDVSLCAEDQEHLEALVYGNISNIVEHFFDYPDYNNYN